MDTGGILSFSNIEYQKEKTELCRVTENELIEKLSSDDLQELIT